MTTSKDVALPPSIVDIIKTRDKIIENWQAIKKAHDENEVLIDNVGVDFAHLVRRNEYPFQTEKQTHELDYSFWVYCLEKLDLTRVMTSFQKSKYLKEVLKSKIPFTPLNVVALFQSASDKFKENSLNSVKDVFGKLISCSYHSNEIPFMKKDNLRKIESNFRVGYSDVHINGNSDKYLDLRHLDDKHDTFRFEDLLNVCRLVEGLGASDYSNNLYSKIKSIPKGTFKVNSEYFELQAFKNGNVKVKWNEGKLDVLDKINKIGADGQAALQSELKKRYKPEHFLSGKAQIEQMFNPRRIPNYSISDIRDFNFFRTPERYADEIADILEEFLDPEITKPSILEPSMGDGALIRSLVSKGLWNENCYGVEYNADRYSHSCDTFKTGSFVQSDFLKWESTKEFDAVVMNPPFHRGIEMFHVIKAWGLLKPNGILICIFPGSDLDRDDRSHDNTRKSKFLDWISEYRIIPDIELPRGTFAGTCIASSIMTLKKGAQ